MASYTHTPPSQSPRVSHHQPIAKPQPQIFLPQLPDPDQLHSSSPRKRQRTQQPNQPNPQQQQSAPARTAQAHSTAASLSTPPPAPANGHTVSLGGSSNGGIPTLRVMEEGGTETFAIPLIIIDGPEALIPILRQTFGQREGNPKIKTAQGDTVPKGLLKHFLKDGVLLVVSFPPLAVPQPSTAVTNHQRMASREVAVSNGSRPNNSTTVKNAINNTNNPPTPYSPPSPSASTTNPLPSLYPSAAQQHLHSHNTHVPHHLPQQQQQQQQQQHQQQQHHHHLHTQPSPRLPTPSPSTSVSTNNALSNSPSTANSNAPAVYKLSRSLKSVPELWQEWTVGLPNLPSVQSLEEQHGPKWRTSQAERKFYSRRKVIIDEIKKLIEVQGRAQEDAINEVEKWRDGRSLDALSKGINERRRNETTAGGGNMQRVSADVAAGW